MIITDRVYGRNVHFIGRERRRYIQKSSGLALLCRTIMGGAGMLCATRQLKPSVGVVVCSCTSNVYYVIDLCPDAIRLGATKPRRCNDSRQEPSTGYVRSKTMRLCETIVAYYRRGLDQANPSTISV